MTSPAYKSDRPHTGAAQNPVQTAGTIVGTLTALLGALAVWGVDSLPASIPSGVSAALLAFAIAAAAVIGRAVGRWTQRYTEPAYIVDELLEAFHDDSPIDPADDTDGL